MVLLVSSKALSRDSEGNMQLSVISDCTCFALLGLQGRIHNDTTAFLIITLSMFHLNRRRHSFTTLPIAAQAQPY